MNQAAQPEAPPLPSSGRLIATLAGIAMMSGLLVVLVVQVTAPRIAHNERVAVEKAIFSVLPGAVTRANYLVTSNGLTSLEQDQTSEANVYAGYDEDGRLVGLALEGEARGYQDVVALMYGYNPDTECITGITVLQSTETPGLGDKIETDPEFQENFDCLKAELNEEGTDLKHDIVTVKHGEKTEPWQIDGVSGATVTSKAVGTALRRSTNKLLPLLHDHLDQLRGAN